MKLTFKSKIPKKYSGWMLTGLTTHTGSIMERAPDFQKQGISIVNSSMMELLTKLDKLGYDSSTALFSIKVKDEHCKL